MANVDPPAPLATFVHDRRVRFSVASEKVIGEDGPIPVGFDVRLRAWHGHDPHALQGCPVCGAIERHLREVAEFSTGADGVAPVEIEIDPDYSALHDSSDVPGTDDVVLDVLVLRKGDDDHGVGDAEWRYLRQLKARLKALGAREC